MPSGLAYLNFCRGGTIQPGINTYTHTHKRVVAFTRSFILFALLCAPFAMATDVCPQWDLSGKWQAVQSNGTTVYVTLKQSGNQVQGTGHYSYLAGGDAFSGDDAYFVDGPMVGTINGNTFEATIYWNNNTIGIYSARVGVQGLMTGNTYDRNNPTTTADWHSDRVMNCAGPAAPSSEPAPERTPAVALGRVPTSGAAATMTICEAAKSARERNSPAAASLEAQCKAQGTTAPQRILNEESRNQYLAAGEALTAQDALATELRNLMPEGAARQGFNLGMGIAEGQTADGPGKQAIRNGLGNPDEQQGFDFAVAYSLDRNANAELASKGAAVIAADPEAAATRESFANAIAQASGAADAAVFYKLGFDIATGLFGDPALGASGNTAMGPGSMRIRNALSAGNTQLGFDDAVKYHLARHYAH